jgi:protein gp37
MNRTSIDWAQYSWNPVVGCQHGCDYCYARRIAERFHGPDGFKPTFHEERLDEPSKIQKPSRIFVGSMCDLFGDWVPQEWINRVLNAAWAAPQHQYLFLTKNPKRYHDFLNGKIPSNWWLGATVTTKDETLDDPVGGLHYAGWHTWISAEPLLEDIADCVSYRSIDWLVIGAMTGPGSKNRQPEFKWIESLTDGAIVHGVPVFHKRSLASFYWPLPTLQQYPTAMMAQLDSKAT